MITHRSVAGRGIATLVGLALAAGLGPVVQADEVRPVSLFGPVELDVDDLEADLSAVPDEETVPSIPVPPGPFRGIFAPLFGKAEADLFRDVYGRQVESIARLPGSPREQEVVELLIQAGVATETPDPQARYLLIRAVALASRAPRSLALARSARDALLARLPPQNLFALMLRAQVEEQHFRQMGPTYRGAERRQQAERTVRAYVNLAILLGACRLVPQAQLILQRDAKRMLLPARDTDLRKVCVQLEAELKDWLALQNRFSGLQKKLKTDPDDAEVHGELAAIYLGRLNDMAGARPHIAKANLPSLADVQKAFESDPAEAVSYYEFADAVRRLADEVPRSERTPLLRLAVENFDKFLKRYEGNDPRSTRAKLWLTKLATDLGDEQPPLLPRRIATFSAGSIGRRDGLLGEYFEGPDFKVLRMVRIDPVLAFPWRHGAPDVTVPRDNFTVRWTGLLQAPQAARYDLRLEHDDGARLYLNGKAVIDNFGSTGQDVVTVGLPKDPVAIRVDFHEAGGDGIARLSWRLAGEGPWRIVDARRFRHDRTPEITALLRQHPPKSPPSFAFAPVAGLQAAGFGFDRRWQVTADEAVLNASRRPQHFHVTSRLMPISPYHLSFEYKATAHRVFVYIEGAPQFELPAKPKDWLPVELAVASKGVEIRVADKPLKLPDPQRFGRRAEREPDLMSYNVIAIRGERAHHMAIRAFRYEPR